MLDSINRHSETGFTVSISGSQNESSDGGGEATVVVEPRPRLKAVEFADTFYQYERLDRYTHQQLMDELNGLSSYIAVQKEAVVRLIRLFDDYLQSSRSGDEVDVGSEVEMLALGSEHLLKETFNGIDLFREWKEDFEEVVEFEQVIEIRDYQIGVSSDVERVRAVIGDGLTPSVDLLMRAVVGFKRNEVDRERLFSQSIETINSKFKEFALYNLKEEINVKREEYESDMVYVLERMGDSTLRQENVVVNVNQNRIAKML